MSNEIQNRSHSCPSNDSQCNTEASTPHDRHSRVTLNNSIVYASYDSRNSSEASDLISCEKSITPRKGEVSKPDKKRWNELNIEFSELNKDSWLEFSCGKSAPEKYATDLSGCLISFLQSKPEFTKKVNEFFKHKKTTKETPLEEATEVKKKLAKKAKSPNATESDRVRADQAVRNHNDLLKLKNQKDKERKAMEENKAYVRNFWKTAKDITNGTFGQPTKTPTYDKSTADKHYRETYEKKQKLTLKNWIGFLSLNHLKLNTI